MINYNCFSENESNSINDEKIIFLNKDNNKEEKCLNNYYNPFLISFSEFRDFDDNLNCFSEKDLKETSKYNNFNLNNCIKKDVNKHNNICKLNNYKFNTNKSEKIFDIKKKSKLGRPKKISTKKGKHNKFHKDNLIRKFKAQFIQKIFNYINISFLKSKKSKKPIKILQKISASQTKSISKSDNLLWLDSKIRTIFSQKISSKIVIYESNYNIKLIEKIYEKKEEIEVIKILEKTVREMLIIYITDDKYNEFPGIKTIKDDIKKFRQKKEPEEYIKLYIYISNNFETIFKNINERKKKLKNIKSNK